MLTIRTQTAISVLHAISSGDSTQSTGFLLSEEELQDLFNKLEQRFLIRRFPEKVPGTLTSYKLCCPLAEISLLDVLEATNEPVRFNSPTPEEFYIRHELMAHKVGVLNQVARTFLADIKISDW